MKHIRAIKIVYLVGFTVILILLWLNEIIDLPYRLLGAPATPFNYREALLESTIVICITVLFAFISFRLEKHIKYLEGLTLICANCKKVKIQDQWIPIEKWLCGNTDVLFSHGVCMDCLKTLYPKEYLSLVRKGKIIPNTPPKTATGL